jgi:hypothetical protein
VQPGLSAILVLRQAVVFSVSFVTLVARPQDALLGDKG